MGKSPLLYQMMGVTSLQTKQVGRKSSSRGFKVEYRTDGDTLYVKKIGTIAAGEPKKKK
jgi:hypothetical protein